MDRTPPSGQTSPFAARTRSPLVGGTTSPNPGTPLPAPLPSVPTQPPTRPTPPKKTSRGQLGLGLGLVALLVGGGLWWGLRGPATDVSPALSSTTAAAKESAAATTLKPGADAAQNRDSAADYATLAQRISAADLPPAERSVVAEAALRAADGAHADAVAKLGPMVAQRARADYTQAAGALAEVKLEEHSGPAVSQLRRSLTRANEAETHAAWVVAMQNRDEARALLPTARAEIAGRFSRLGQEARERGELAMATLFYERVLRLDPAHAEARAHLFAHKFSPGQALRTPSGLELAYVPPGEFMRGSRAAEPGRGPDEDQAKVRLSEGFFMAVTEVTQRQWDLAFGAGAAARHLEAARVAPTMIGPDLPMHSVRWDEAREFCQTLSQRDGRVYRLPTEAEWEYACRAGTTSAFNLGTDGLSAREANLDDASSDARFAPAPSGVVGRPNAWGLRDLHGNVWEWCADWSAPYPAGEQLNPRGPDDATVGRLDLAMRVVRGGAWNAPASEARSANRWEYAPAVGTPYIGFRFVLEPDLVAP